MDVIVKDFPLFVYKCQSPSEVEGIPSSPPPPIPLPHPRPPPLSSLWQTLIHPRGRGHRTGARDAERRSNFWRLSFLFCYFQLDGDDETTGRYQKLLLASLHRAGLITLHRWEQDPGHPTYQSESNQDAIYRALVRRNWINQTNIVKWCRKLPRDFHSGNPRPVKYLSSFWMRLRNSIDRLQAEERKEAVDYLPSERFD